ncbi:MAG TPA: hypothetical protein VGV09_12240 [Steroidobacteraceae bacterium]|nr:hypothetical protein [Steroidobacteraceae bacterium]
MIETNSFLAMFTIQILVGSVVSPAWLIRRVRARLASFPIERLAELFPSSHHELSAERLGASADRFATRYRLLNLGVAAVGLLLLAWLFVLLRRPDWNQGRVSGLIALYLLAQMSPLAFLGWKASRVNKVLKSSQPDAKRKAMLQRRGLFDFVSPVLVFFAVLSYFLFAALVLYIRQHPFPGFGGLTNIVIITLAWVFNAFLIYGCLYGRNRNPLVTHADRLYVIGMVVKICIWSSIAGTVFASLQLTLSLLHMRRWELFALSAFFVVATLISSLGVIPRRRPTTAAPGSDTPLPPGAQNLSA